MLFYFTGTGNSGYVAETLGNFLSLNKKFIPDYDAAVDDLIIERVLFVFPVYSWGVPPLVAKFIQNIPSSFWENIVGQGYPVDCVMVCGDEVALAPEMFAGILKRVGVKLNSVFSVIMPNNYVILPGFDVDAKEVEIKKLEDCKGRIMEVAQKLNEGLRTIDVTRGTIPWIKTKLVYPLFKKWGIFPRKWKYTDSCISCGRCAAICPMVNIRMIENHPQWGSRCCSCLACYHICPVHAVAYGKETRTKGQYMFPLFNLKNRT